MKKNACIPLLTTLSVLISGCGNFISTTIPSTGWNEVGINRTENPYIEPLRQYGDKYRYTIKTDVGTQFQTIWDYEAKILAVGPGEKVLPGDLVKIRLRILESDGPDYSDDFHEMILYVGRTDFEDRRTAFWTKPKFGFELGSIKVRRALIGRSVGERITLRRPIDVVDSQGDNPELIPFKALLVKHDSWTNYLSNYSKEFLHLKTNDSKYQRLSYIQLSGNKIAIEIEVIDTCKSVLSIKETKIVQAGEVFKWGGGPDFLRSATYQWAAVEPMCHKAEKFVHIQAGPVYMGGQQYGNEAPSPTYSIPASQSEYEVLGYNKYRLRKH